MKLSEILKKRGYIYQHSAESLEEITDGPKRTLYFGIDPTADSMHVGHLVCLLTLRHFLQDGHKVIILTGGGTGMIGDPGGRSEERNLLDEKTVEHNTKAVAAQIRQVFGSSDFVEENNAKWLNELKLLEFLRDIGKYFTVNSMIKKDTVRTRLEAEVPMSFTEFSYSLLQGYDYLHLQKAYGCDVQVGGSDQWSNILSGVEFIRRKTGKTVYAFTWPLLINKSTGKKFGKSEGGAIWLDPAKTSPFQFYQFWLNAEDADVADYLLKMTLLSTEEIEQLVNNHKAKPEERKAQRTLAFAVTELIHGRAQADASAQVSEVLFGGADLAALSEAARAALSTNAPTVRVNTGEMLVDVLVTSTLASSKREAREFIEGGAIMLGNKKADDINYALADADFQNGLALLRRGKRNVCILTKS